jgi:superfamily II DNA/RNA helicase
MSWQEFLLYPSLIRSLKAAGYTGPPSLVQWEGIPQAMIGSSLITVAPAGMGKTIMSAIAIIQQATGFMAPEEKPAAIVFCPTPELCMQTVQVYTKLTAKNDEKVVIDMWCNSPKDSWTPGQHSSASVLVAVPSSDLVSLVAQTKHIVYEYFDYMWDNSAFKSTLEEVIIAATSRSIQQFFLCSLPPFSDPKFEFITSKIPTIYRIDVANMFLDRTTHYKCVNLQDETSRLLRVHQLLSNTNYTQCIIFASSMDQRESIASHLHQAGSDQSITKFHEGVSLPDRLEAISTGSLQSSQILIVTEAVFRGLDLPGANLVINFDSCQSFSSYYERSTRAGRFATNSKTISLCGTSDSADLGVFAAVEKYLLSGRPLEILEGLSATK